MKKKPDLKTLSGHNSQYVLGWEIFLWKDTLKRITRFLIIHKLCYSYLKQFKNTKNIFYV